MNSLPAEEQISKAELRLTDIADALQGDWVLLAQQLGITDEEIARIQSEYQYDGERALVMLHLWVQKNADQATGPSGLYILDVPSFFHNNFLMFQRAPAVF